MKEVTFYMSGGTSFSCQSNQKSIDEAVSSLSAKSVIAVQLDGKVIYVNSRNVDRIEINELYSPDITVNGHKIGYTGLNL